MENNPASSQPAGDATGPSPSDGPEAPTTGPPSSEVIASRLTLRTPVMWLVSVLLIVVAAVMILVSPKMGAFAMAALLVIVGTARLVVPGTPFGFSARNRFWDVSFCYAVALAIVILTNSAHSLK